MLTQSMDDLLMAPAPKILNLKKKTPLNEAFLIVRYIAYLIGGM